MVQARPSSISSKVPWMGRLQTARSKTPATVSSIMPARKTAARLPNTFAAIFIPKMLLPEIPGRLGVLLGAGLHRAVHRPRRESLAFELLELRLGYAAADLAELGILLRRQPDRLGA